MTSRHPLGTPGFEAALRRFDPQVAGVIRLSAQLCAEPGVTVPAHRADLAAVRRTMALAAARAQALGLEVQRFEPDEARPYPLLIAWSPGADPRSEAVREAIVLVGHLDVVAAEPSQWQPSLEGEALHARGATDMKTVAATFLEWMGARGPLPAGGPARVVVLSGCEENGSAAPWSAEDALDWLERDCGCRVRFAIVGERTGELEWMAPPPIVGPVCRENRSWRWLRCTTEARGAAALAQIAALVRQGRQAVAALNRSQIPAEKADRQPGLRSGWLCSFAWIPGEPAQGPLLCVERRPGASVHAAAADAAAPSSLEILAQAFDTAREAASAQGAQLALAALQIGEDGNFNSVDGSGRLWLSWSGPGLQRGIEALAQRPELGVAEAREIPAGPQRALFGLDIRELLDHQEAVQELLGALAAAPGVAVQAINARPAWRCPEDCPDLAALLQAWSEVAGAPSPDLVKLHGNDGGLIAARSRVSGQAPVVVFGQVGARPHGPDEMHDCRSIRPYWDILDRFAERVWPAR